MSKVATATSVKLLYTTLGQFVCRLWHNFP